jgi:membrane protein YqaA with SNARE-associated domain
MVGSQLSRYLAYRATSNAIVHENPLSRFPAAAFRKPERRERGGNGGRTARGQRPLKIRGSPCSSSELEKAIWTPGLSSFSGSASAALLLVLAFHHLGWNQLVGHSPQIETSQTWIVVSRWLEKYQLIALFGVAASPLPLAPALIFAAISAVPPVRVLVALCVAKILQYGVAAWLVARFPQRFARRSSETPNDFVKGKCRLH